MRNLLAAALLAAAAAAHGATSFSTDVTDLWWNPNESGWGVNLIQQNNVIFATFFVYDTNSRAHWYAASNLTGAANADGTLTFIGPLYETQGPYFGGSFDPSAVVRNQVGTAALRFTLPNAGTLSYTVNGTQVVKQITRQTWAVNDATGQYSGWRSTRVVAQGGCQPTSGPAILTAFTGIQLAQSTTAFSMRGALGTSGTCQFTGDYSQQGHMGASSGTYTCTNGLQGTYQLTEIEATLYGFFARYNGTEQGCPITGRLGAVRTTIRQQAQ
jgi:hypothetical protein